MKHLILLLAVLLMVGGLTATTFTAKSLLFADSYMLRAVGCEANYWNPAMLSKENSSMWMPILNTGIYAGNNSLSLDLYNYIMTTAFLDETAKQHILDAIDERIALNIGGDIGVFGFSMGNTALTSSIHLGTKAALSEEFIRLALYGNGDGDDTYEFTEDDNYLTAMSYLDLTLGVGDIRLPLPETIPDIKFGAAASFLGGIADAHSEDVYGILSSTLDGFYLRGDARLLVGAGGAGFKGLVGLYSEPIKNLHAGITVDNIFGFIKWGLVREQMSAHIEIDTLYVADFLTETSVDSLVDWSAATSDIDIYTTSLPLEFRAAVMYNYKILSVSADYVHGLANSPEVSKQGRLSLGLELRPIPILPIMIGYGMGNDTYPWRMSYGIGLDFKVVEFGLGIQSLGALIPSTATKGLCASIFFNIKY